MVDVMISIYIPCRGKGACVLIWVSSRGDANCDAAGSGEATAELECSVRMNGRIIVISVAHQRVPENTSAGLNDPLFHD